MILKTYNYNHRITAKKDKNGLYLVFNEYKNIFGSLWNSEKIAENLTKSQVLYIKLKLN